MLIQVLKGLRVGWTLSQCVKIHFDGNENVLIETEAKEMERKERMMGALDCLEVGEANAPHQTGNATWRYVKMMAKSIHVCFDSA
jgi:hypothetical protein